MHFHYFQFDGLARQGVVLDQHHPPLNFTDVVFWDLQRYSRKDSTFKADMSCVVRVDVCDFVQED